MSCLATLGSRKHAASSAAKRLAIGFGVLAGANTPHQACASKPGNPLSCTVGNSANAGARVLPVCTMVGLLVVAPGYLQSMAEDSDGKWMIGGAVAAQILGNFFIKRIINIKV